MKEQIENLRQEMESFVVNTSSDVETYRLKFLTKKSILNQLFAEFKTLDPDQKKIVGKELNLLKRFAEDLFQTHKEKYSSDQGTNSQNRLDLSLPGHPALSGNRHPLQIVRNRMIDIFMRMGFDVSEGPEIEDDWHNFSALNFPENHPARDMQDTFFIDANRSLRTHTSSVQVRVMENNQPPIRTISPGRVYRNEAISARSNCFFHQIEGLYIDHDVSFADLKQTLFQFVKEFFGADTKVRFRPSYFPFTEPSAEMDIYLGTETEADYRLTKGSGWLEILGCGMVDKQVLSNCGIDPKEYRGFAFGMGIERITMFQYGIKDLRTFFDNDVRFLKQFASV